MAHAPARMVRIGQRSEAEVAGKEGRECSS